MAAIAFCNSWVGGLKWRNGQQKSPSAMEGLWQPNFGELGLRGGVETIATADGRYPEVQRGVAGMAAVI